MIDGKSVAKACIWHSIKVWSIPLMVWLVSAYYFASQKNFLITEIIIWSPLIVAIYSLNCCSIPDYYRQNGKGKEHE